MQIEWKANKRNCGACSRRPTATRLMTNRMFYRISAGTITDRVKICEGGKKIKALKHMEWTSPWANVFWSICFKLTLCIWLCALSISWKRRCLIPSSCGVWNSIGQIEYECDHTFELEPIIPAMRKEWNLWSAELKRERGLWCLRSFVLSGVLSVTCVWGLLALYNIHFVCVFVADATLWACPSSFCVAGAHFRRAFCEMCWK